MCRPISFQRPENPLAFPKWLAKVIRSRNHTVALSIIMKSATQIHLADVQSVYSGAEGRLWELLMGEQIHLGGFQSSVDLAKRAGLAAGMCGVDLGCASGAGMRFLVRFVKIARMTGVDATPAMVELGRHRVAAEGLDASIDFVLGDACDTGLPTEEFDFVWGEDAWCCVENKPQLIAEASRLIRPGGKIAFTDWVEGPAGLTNAEAESLLNFMKFPNLLTLDEYQTLLLNTGCRSRVVLNTDRLATSLPIYLEMIEKQLTYDTLKIINFDTAQAAKLVDQLRFIQSLAEAGKIVQGLIVAEKMPERSPDPRRPVRGQ